MIPKGVISLGVIHSRTNNIMTKTKKDKRTNNDLQKNTTKKNKERLRNTNFTNNWE